MARLSTVTVQLEVSGAGDLKLSRSTVTAVTVTDPGPVTYKSEPSGTESEGNIFRDRDRRFEFNESI